MRNKLLLTSAGFTVVATISGVLVALYASAEQAGRYGTATDVVVTGAVGLFVIGLATRN